MSITYKSPKDEDGFFNFFNGAIIFDGDSYLVKLKDGTTREACGSWEECMYVADPDTGEAIDDVEWIKPLRPEDRISLMITATEVDINWLDSTLSSLALHNTGCKWPMCDCPSITTNGHGCKVVAKKEGENTHHAPCGGCDHIKKAFFEDAGLCKKYKAGSGGKYCFNWSGGSNKGKDDG